MRIRYLKLISKFLCLGYRNIRVANGDQRQGRLEVYRNGMWGTVCDDSFGTIDAAVNKQNITCIDLIKILLESCDFEKSSLLPMIALSTVQSSPPTRFHNATLFVDIS